MVRYLVKDFYRDKKVYANFKLKKIKYKPLDVLEILEMEKGRFNLDGVSCAIDELTVFADCRTSMKKMNRFLSYFILQTRKRDVTLYYTTQDFNMVDLRVINHTDIRVLAEKILRPDGETYYDDYRKYTIYDLRDIRHLNWKSFTLKISNYYDYYDTYEVILPPI